MSTEAMKKLIAKLDALHAELEKHLDKCVHCRAIEGDTILFGAFGPLKMYLVSQAVRRYEVVGPTVSDKVAFSALELLQILELNGTVFITVKKRGYKKIKKP